jgi:hypothetical protein
VLECPCLHFPSQTLYLQTLASKTSVPIKKKILQCRISFQFINKFSNNNSLFVMIILVIWKDLTNADHSA